MKRLALITMGLVLFTLGSTAVTAQEVERLSRTIEAEDARELQIEVDFGAGEFDLTTADMAEVAKVDVHYMPRYIRSDIEYEVNRGVGELFLESSHRKRSWSHDDDLENEWTVVLSERYPTDLRIEMGACDSRIDFGSLPLTNLDIEVGASSSVIDFSEPNSATLEEFNLEAGASSIEVTNLGNANCKRLDFEIGAASCELDFRGDFKGEAEAILEVGVGSVDIIVPRGLDVRLEGDDGWFSSIDFHGIRLREVDDGVWETDGFDDADDRLIIQADVAMGSIDIYSRR